jgi:fermentation-respiration switch protein FrsA (DUF1100 family)
MRAGGRPLPVRDVRFASASGSTIHGWFAAGRPGGGAVLLLHGVGASRRAMTARAEFLNQSGFAVLMPDFRSHGESRGGRTTYGALESHDAAAALAFLRAQACGERVGVIGVSMGGAAALLGDAPLPVEALVLESVYPTIRDATADRLETWLGPLGFAGRWATPLALRWLGWRSGVREAQLRPIEHIAAVRAPLLMLAGTADPYTPLDEARALYERAPAPKRLWAIAGAKHEDLHAYAGPEYERRVGGFLVRHLATIVVDSSGGPGTVAGAGADAEEGADGGNAPECLDDEERRRG